MLTHEKVLQVFGPFYQEDGAKNPLKSITVKHLVLASYAQFGVGAGWQEIWAIVMAYDHDPCFCGDLSK